MKLHTYSSLVCASLNIASNERLAIGLILFNEEKIIFRYSKSKLQICAQLMTVLQLELLQDSMSELYSCFDLINILGVEESLHDAIKYFKRKGQDIDIISTKYDVIFYLHQISHNIYNVDAPAKVEIELEQFNNLYRALVSKHDAIIL